MATPNGPTLDPTDRRARFLRVAPGRVNRALRALRAVRRLAAKGLYTHTIEERDELHNALCDEFAELTKAFYPQPKPRRAQQEAFAFGKRKLIQAEEVKNADEG